MRNPNTSVRYDPKATTNTGLVDLTRTFRSKDNAEFFAHVGRAIAKKRDDDERSLKQGARAAIVLLGEYGHIGSEFRSAQRELRLDRRPSLWSHAALLTDELPTSAESIRRGGPWLYESTLEPADGFGSYADRVGVSARRLGDYSRGDFHPAREHSCPNVAVIVFEMSAEESKKIHDRATHPALDQGVFDFTGLLATWYGFILGRGSVPNPLASGVAIPSSAYVQFAYDAISVDLGPGAQQRNTTPEHIWQGVRKLHELCRTYTRPTTLKGKVESTERSINGWYCARDMAGVICPPEATLPLTLPEAIKNLRG